MEKSVSQAIQEESRIELEPSRAELEHMEEHPAYAEEPSKKSSSWWIWLIILLLVAGGVYWWFFAR